MIFKGKVLFLDDFEELGIGEEIIRHPTEFKNSPDRITQFDVVVVEHQYPNMNGDTGLTCLTWLLKETTIRPRMLGYLNTQSREKAKLNSLILGSGYVVHPIVPTIQINNGENFRDVFFFERKGVDGCNE